MATKYGKMELLSSPMSELFGTWDVSYLTETEYTIKQECIPVGCVPPAHWPHLMEKTTHAPPPEEPHTPLGATMHAPRATTHAPPQSNHACPPSNHACPPGATTYAPPEQPCMPIPPRATTHTPPEQPRMPPREQPCMPPQSSHACPPPKQPRMPPLGATMHTPPEQPHMPPEQPRTPSPCGQTDTCKNITFANFVCGR